MREASTFKVKHGILGKNSHIGQNALLVMGLANILHRGEEKVTKRRDEATRKRLLEQMHELLIIQGINKLSREGECTCKTEEWTSETKPLCTKCQASDLLGKYEFACCGNVIDRKNFVRTDLPLSWTRFPPKEYG